MRSPASASDGSPHRWHCLQGLPPAGALSMPGGMAGAFSMAPGVRGPAAARPGYTQAPLGSAATAQNPNPAAQRPMLPHPNITPQQIQQILSAGAHSRAHDCLHRPGLDVCQVQFGADWRAQQPRHASLVLACRCAQQLSSAVVRSVLCLLHLPAGKLHKLL